MIEVVFSKSACGSLKVAQSYGKGSCRGAAVSVFIKDADNTLSPAELRAARLRAEEQARKDWETAVPLHGQPEDIYCFSLALSIGDISDGGMGQRRKEVLRRLLSVDPSADPLKYVDEHLQKTASDLSSLQARCAAGEPIRIWYSHNPDELCGMYWLMAQLQPLVPQGPIYLVKLPLWEYGSGNTVISRIGWGEIGPGEWGTYLSSQEEVRPALLSACSVKWKQLQEINAPLRVTLNGHIQSVPEDIYDSFILREIAAQPDEFKMAVAIGNILGKYQLGIGDAFIALRMEKLIRDGLLEVVQEAPPGQLRYRRILRKSSS